MSGKSEEIQERKTRRNEIHDHLRSAQSATRKSMEAWLPAGFIEHRRLARKEFLLAMRSLIDSVIDHLE